MIAKAKEIGFEAIVFVDILPPVGITKEEYAKVLTQECAHQGIQISCFTFGADFISGSNGDTQLEIQRVKKQIDIAVILGVNLVRHDATRGDGRPSDAVVGHGDVPVTQCLSILKNIGYDSYIAIEFEGMEDTITGITIGYENLKRYINEI